MADLEYTVKVSGVEDVERLEKNLDNLHRTLNAGSGAGKSLEEMRKILVGMRGQASIIADLRDSVKSLNSAAENLGKGFESGFSKLDKTLKQGFQLTLDRVNMLGAEMSKGLSSGVKGAFDAGAQAAAAGGKRVASAIRAAGEDATSELAAWHAKDIKLNAKYATDLGVAQQQVLDKGTSTMVSSLRKRAEVIARLLQEEGTIGQEVATKAYGTDFVNAVKAGLIGQQKLFEDHIQTVKKLGEAQVDAYVGKMNQQAVDRARAVAKEQLEANARAIKEELAAAADAFAKSPDTLANMRKFYTLETSVAQASVDRARKVAKEQFAANSRAIKEELAAAAQAHLSSEETLRSMRQFYTWQASVAQAATDRAREIAKAQFQANSRAIKEELAAAAQAHLSSEETLRSMRQFYTWQASVAQAATDRARAAAKAQFQANSRAIKEELAAAADAFAKSPDTLANMRKFYTLQASAAGYVEERARKEAREAFAARSKAFKEEAAKFSQESYGGAMRQLASQYTNPKEMAYMGQLRDPSGLAYMGQLRDATVKLSTAQEKLRSTSDPLRSSLRALAIDGNDTHSAMRGLASGFNLLWLTWGKLAPLFAGAGISYTLTRAFSVGSEVEYQIKFMEELGHTADATGKRIEGVGGVIRQELRKLNEESMFSIVELSKAMTDLGQTNYSVAESLQILRPATALATAGLVDLDTATKTLIQVNALFGRTAEDTSRTAAQLFHITKSSVLNVEDLAGAFRYASEVNTKFHGSLEESLVLFSALSKAGIKGQAAGTAMINMYRDIYGRSGPAIKALEGLRKATGDTIKTFDEFGKRRPILDIFEDIHKAAQKLPLEIADKYLSSLYSARGGRTHFAIARDDAEKLREVLDELRQVKPEELFKAAEGLMDTTKGAAEILKSTMTNTLDEVFEAYEKGFKDFIVALTAGIRSDEFKETLFQITAAAQGLFNVVKNNFGLVSTFGKLLLGWGALKFTVSALGGLASAITGVAGVITLARGGMVGLSTSVTANTAATGLNITAQKTSAQAHYQNMVAKALMAKGYDAETAKAAAATAATTVYTGAVTRANFVTRGFAATMAFLTGPVGLVVTALGTLASIYYSTKSAAEDAAAGMSEASDRYTNKSLANISKEIKALTARNMVLHQQDEFSEAEAEIRKKSAAFAKAVEGYEAQRAKFANAAPGADMKHFDARAMEQLEAKQRELNMLWGELDEARRVSAEAREKREAEAAKKAEDAAKKAAKAFEALIKPQGTSDLGGDRNNFVDLNRDKELQALKAHYDAELAVANDYYNKSKQLLDGHRSANLISEEEYMVQSLRLSRSHEAEQLQVLEASLTAYTEASERRKAALESQMSGAKGKGKNMLLDQLKKETQEFEIFVTNYEKERAKVAAESYARVGETVLKLQTEVGKLLKTSEDFWDNAAVSSAAQKEADELADKYKNMNTSILSMDSAMFEFEKAQKSTQDEVRKMNAALERQLSIQKSLLQVEVLSLEAAQVSGNLTMDELIQRVTLISQFKEGIEKLEGGIENNTEKGLELGAERGWEAFQKMREKQVEELASSMSEAITDGLMSGDYKSIGKSIRDTLQKELIRKPLQAWIQATIGSVLGGVSAQSAAGTGQVQELSNLFSGNSGLTLGTSVGNWLSDTGFTVASGANLGTVSNALGNSMIDLGNTITQWDSALQAIPGFEGGFGSVFAYGKAIFDIIEGNYGSGIGTAAGTYLGSFIPGIGTAIGAFLGGTLGGLFDGGSPYYGGDAVSVGGKQSWTGKQGGGYDSGIGNFFGSYAQGISAALTGILKDEILVKIGFDENEKRARAYLDLYDTAGNIAVTRSGVSVAKGEAGAKETVDLVAKEAFTALLADDRLATYEKQLIAAASAAGATYENLISAYTQINAVNVAFSGLATTMTMFVGISDDMKAALLNGLGGIEGLSQATQTYYDNFYTEAERLTIAGRNMNQVMQSLGLDIDVMQGDLAKEAFRKSVEAAFEAGNGSLAASLLGVSGQFAEIADAAQAASDNLGTAEGAINSYAEALANLAEKAGYLGSTNRYAAENAAGTIQSLFANIGIEKDVTALTSSILYATTADVEDFFRELWPMMQTDAARDQLIKVSDALLDIAARSRELSLNLATLQERLGDTSAIRNFNLDTVTADLVSFGKTLGQSLNFESVRAEIASANKESVKAYFNDVFKGLDTTEAQQKFIGITNAILDVVDATEAAVKDFRSEAESLWNDQVSAAKAAVEAQIALHEREAEAVRVLINNAEQEIDRLKSEGEIFKLIAGRAFGEAGVKSGTSYKTGSSSTWEEFAAKFGFLDDQNEALVSAQEKLVADLKNEEARHNNAIKHLQGIISESQKQTSQLMSLNTAIDILQTSTETGIADIVEALKKSAAPAVVAPPAETPSTSTPAADAVSDAVSGALGGGALADKVGDLLSGTLPSLVELATEKMLKLFEEQRPNAVAALAGDASAADKFFAAMKAAGVTMFDDVANHSIAFYDAEISRLKGLLKPVETAKAALAAAPAAVAAPVAVAAPAAEKHTTTIPGIGGSPNNAFVIPSTTKPQVVPTVTVVAPTTTVAPVAPTTPSGLKPMTAAEYQEELNLQLRLFELEGNMLAVRKSQLAMMHANLRGIQAEVWAREALNTVTQQFEELNPAGKLTAIKDEAKDFIDGLSTIDASTAKGKKTLAAAKKLALQVEKQRLAEAREELYSSVATERWKVNSSLRDLRKDFKGLGITMPKTVEGFRALIDATTDRSLKDSLLELAPAFVEAANAAEALAQKNKELYSNLLSERELSNLGTSDVTEKFKELGYELPKSSKELKSWIDKLPTGELKDSLLSLIPSFTEAANAAEALAQKNKELYSGLLSPDQVTALNVADLRKQFAEFGFVMPTTKEAFRNLLDTLSDGELKGSLLELVPAFTGIETVASEAAAKLSAAWASIGTASGWAAEHLLDSSGLEYQLATIRSGLANTTDVQEREAAISDIISLEQAIWDVQQRRLKKGLEATQKQFDADQEKLDSANKLLDAAKSLKEYANELMTGTNSGLSKVEQLAAKQSEYESLLVKARTGDVESINKLRDVSGEYLALADELSVSQTDYSFLAGKTAAELLTLSTIQEASAKSQIEVLEYGIELAQRQLEKADEEFELSLETKKLIEQQLEDARLQFQTETTNMLSVVTGLGIANGLLEALPASLAGVLGPMINSAIASSAGSSKSSSGSSTSSAIPTPADITNPMPRPVTILPDPVYEAPKTGTSTVVKDIVTSTTPTSSAKTTSSVTMSDIIAASKADAAAGTRPEGIKTTADMIAYYRPILSGSHSTGLTSVPFDGYIAELHKGERVLTAAEAKVYTPPESTTQAELVAEIRALRAQVAALEKSASKTASNTAKLPQMAEQFDDVADGGFVRTRSVS